MSTVQRRLSRIFAYADQQSVPQRAAWCCARAATERLAPTRRSAALALLGRKDWRLEVGPKPLGIHLPSSGPGAPCAVTLTGSACRARRDPADPEPPRLFARCDRGPIP